MIRRFCAVGAAPEQVRRLEQVEKEAADPAGEQKRASAAVLEAALTPEQARAINAMVTHEEHPAGRAHPRRPEPGSVW